MAVKKREEAQNPLILRCNRLIEAFTKSDDERDFYMDRLEGFLVYIDLDKTEEELHLLEAELEKNKDRYCMIPKLTFYETKKIMEGFVNEKVYDIDTKEKLLDIIQSKEARENFLDFIYDHHSELEKWQTYYQERSRIRIIEWLRNNHFHFVFEEDLDLPKMLIERLKKELFQTKAGKDVLAARKTLIAKAKTYYSNEALNPRPKRGRPPKQAQKAEVEQQASTDIYITVPPGLRGFLFTPDLTNPSAATFSSKFGNEEELFSNRRIGSLSDSDVSQETLDQKLAVLRKLSNKWVESENAGKAPSFSAKSSSNLSFSEDFSEDDEDEDEDDELFAGRKRKKPLNGLKSEEKMRLPPKILPKAPASKSAQKSSQTAPKLVKGKVETIKTAKLPAKPTTSKSKAFQPRPAPKAAVAVPKKAPSKPLPAKRTNAAAIAKKAPPRVQAKPTATARKPAPKAAASPSKKKPMRPIQQLKKKR